MSSARPWAGNSPRIQTPNDTLPWKEVREAYYWDRLEAAHTMALELGAGAGGWGLGMYRMIETEYMSRKHGSLRSVTSWLDVEFMPEAPEQDGLCEQIVAACDDVATRFGFAHDAKTLVTFIGQASDAPWTIGRYGYMVDKYPYDKICIPASTVHDERRFKEVVAHEYGHVVSLNLAQYHLPHWMDEMVAVTAQREFDPQAVDLIAMGETPWLSYKDIETALTRDRRGDAEVSTIHAAYQQAGILGQYLISLRGEGSIGDLLRAFANNSNWTQLRMTLTGEAPVDEAMNEVFGFSCRELFDLAERWVKGR